MSARSGGDALAQDDAVRLRAVIARTDRLLGRQVAGSGLTRTQFSVLGAVVRGGPQPLAALVEREGLNPTMLSRVVGALERTGLLRRVPHPADRRAVVVEVTVAGAELYQRLQTDRSGLIADYLAALPAADLAALRAALPVLEGLGRHLAADPVRQEQPA